MKLIFSLHVGKNVNYYGEFCGYRNRTELLDSLLLSSIVSGKYFDKVELYCCSFAEKIIKEDGRDFSHIKIINCLDHLNDTHADNWALSKIYVYSLQTEPFLHLDIDAFFFNRLPDELLKKPFLFQMLEMHSTHPFYNDAYKEAKLLNLLPKEVTYKPEYSINTAVFAVSDEKYFPLLKEYYEIASNYTKQNVHYLGKMLHGWHQCILFEQLFLVNLLEREGLKYKKDFDTILSNKYIDQYDIKYTHLICGAKRKQENVEKIRKQLSIRTKDKKNSYEPCDTNSN